MNGAAHDLALALDMVAFARATGLMEPDPWQVEVLRSTAPRVLLNCARQAGKSTTVALLAAHVVTFQPGALVLVVSPTERQSVETLHRVRAILSAMHWPVPSRADGIAHLELENGSRLVALPGHDEGSVRGYSAPTLLVFDEASRIANALYFAVSPMLAVSGGRALALSTPFGTRGWWYQACREAMEARSPTSLSDAVPAWEYVELLATQCPRISAEFLESERRAMGAWWFNQEYGCQFLDAQTAAFTQADIERVLSEDYEPWALNLPPLHTPPQRPPAPTAASEDGAPPEAQPQARPPSIWERAYDDWPQTQMTPPQPGKGAHGYPLGSASGGIVRPEREEWTMLAVDPVWSRCGRR